MTLAENGCMAELAWSDALERSAVRMPGPTMLEAPELQVRVVNAAQFVIAVHLDPREPAPPGALLDALSTATAHALPTIANTRSGADDDYAVWLDPARWLIVRDRSNRSTSLRALQAAVNASSNACVSDVSDGLAVLDIAGVRASELMAMACSLDCDPATFAPPRTARTGFAGAGPAVLYRHGSGFRVHVDATLIAHAQEWIEQAVRLLPSAGTILSKEHV
jgi:heterotetrameric sarcosine oxidase gamma subunit